MLRLPGLLFTLQLHSSLMLRDGRLPRVWSLGARIQGSHVLGAGFKIQGLGLRIEGLGSRLEGPGFRIGGFQFWEVFRV
jgi:hypothetical protein